MSVMEILEQRARENFRERVTALMKQRGITRNELCRAIYGVNEKGAIKGSGHLSQIMSGQQRAQMKTMERWAAALGITVDEMADFYTVPQTPSPATEVTVVRRKSTEDQFSLVIDQRGMATLRVNLIDVPMSVAMQAMSALTGAGLLSGPES